MPDKFVREIEEILKETEDLDSSDSVNNASTRDFGTNDFIDKPVGILRSSNMMLAGIAFLLLAAFARQILPEAVRLLVWTGIIMFIGAYVLFFIKPKRKKYQKKWRGRVIETETNVSLLSKIISSFRKRS